MNVIHTAADMIWESSNLHLVQIEEKTEGISLMIHRCAIGLIKSTRTCQVHVSRMAGLEHDLGLEHNRLLLCYGPPGQLHSQKQSSQNISCKEQYGKWITPTTVNNES